MNQEKSSITTWVAWVALIIGIIAFIMAWAAMNDTNSLREEIEQAQVTEDPAALPPAPEPINGTSDPMNGMNDEANDATPEGSTEPDGSAEPAPLQ